MNPSNEAGGAQVPDSGQVPGNSAGAVPPAMPTDPAANSMQPMTFPLPPAAQSAAQPATPPPTPQNMSQNAPQTPRTPQQIDVAATTQSATPPVIDDGDLIEKEWVNKAKEIVNKNRNDPYKQSEELTRFRADYMKKRYNKNIKLDE